MKKIIAQPLSLVAMMFAVFTLELLLPGNFFWLGIHPRSTSGLIGVVASPFLHADLRHLLANALPIFVMGALVSALSPSLFVARTAYLIVFSGLLTWLISYSGVVIGASGLVFAYWSYLITNGFLNKRVKDVFIALITALVYGALAFALLKFDRGVSWAAHFSGAVTGVVFAYWQHKPSIKF